MSGYSRVTLVATRRRVDALLPADETLGELMPELLTLVDEPVYAPARIRQLVTAGGDVLADDETLRRAGVPDGAVLRLVARDQAPPVPIVHDVTEEVADATDARAWRWGPAARRWCATACLAAAGGFAAALVRDVVSHPAAAGIAAGAAAVAAAVGVLTALGGREQVGTALVLAGGGAAWVAAWTGADAGTWTSAARWGALAAVAAGIAVLLGLTTALGRGGLVGGGAGLLLAAAWTAGARAAMKPEDLAAALGVVSVVVLGLLPRWALTTSGLTGLDDRRTAGTPVARSEVNAALAGAHRGLALAAVAAAASAGVAGFVLAARPDRWTVPLALLLAGALLCRARAFPLVAEVVALVAAAVGIVGALLAAWWARASGAPGGPLVTVLALAAVPLLALAVEPAEHVRAALRRFGDLLEAACVVAAVPVAIGVSGVFGELLRTF